MREDKCGRARRDFTHSIFSSISRTSEYGSTFYHMRLTVSQWCRMRCAMWPCSIRSYRTVSLAVRYCGPAAWRFESEITEPNPFPLGSHKATTEPRRTHRLWRTEFRQCTADVAPFCSFTSFHTHHQLECPSSTHPDCMARPSSSLAQAPVSARYSSFPMRPLITAADKSYICANIHFQATAILFAKVPACAMFIRLSEAIL